MQLVDSLKSENRFSRERILSQDSSWNLAWVFRLLACPIGFSLVSPYNHMSQFLKALVSLCFCLSYSVFFFFSGESWIIHPLRYPFPEIFPSTRGESVKGCPAGIQPGTFFCSDCSASRLHRLLNVLKSLLARLRVHCPVRNTEGRTSGRRTSPFLKLSLVCTLSGLVLFSLLCQGGFNFLQKKLRCW